MAGKKNESLDEILKKLEEAEKEYAKKLEKINLEEVIQEAAAKK